jgi:hypothetical protein
MDLNSGQNEDWSNEFEFESKGGWIKWIWIWIKKLIDQIRLNLKVNENRSN